MPLLNRDTLHKLFSRGSRPTEKHFADLIDASANKLDDGFSVSPEHGLSLAPLAENKKLMSIFRSPRDREPALSWSLDPLPHVNGLKISDQQGQDQLFFKQGGNIGIHTDKPAFPLHVAGYVGMQGREGTFASGQVPADSYWHTIVAGLDGLQAFEVNAAVVKNFPKEDEKKRKRRPRSAYMQGIALAAYEGRGARNKIRHMHSASFFWDRIYLRWIGDVHNYRLQIRTLFSYGREEKTKGEPIMISYKVSQLWSDHITLEQREA